MSSDDVVGGTGLRGLGADELVGELEITCAAGVPPDYKKASPYLWANACHKILEAGRMEILEYAARHLHDAYPDLEYLKTLVAWFDAIPRHLPPPLAFRDDPKAEIQVVVRSGCDSVLFCFCAAQGTLGVPVNLSHEWLGRLPVTLVYVKDLRNLHGARGYPTLGADREASVKALGCLAKSLGGVQIYTLGVSQGGYPALYYGLRLGAQGVLNIAGLTDLTHEFNERLSSRAGYLDVIGSAPDYALSMREFYRSAERRPRVLLAFGAGAAHDRRHAEQMEGLRGVDLIAVDNYAPHNVVDPLMQRQDYLDLLYRLLSLAELSEEIGSSSPQETLL